MLIMVSQNQIFLNPENEVDIHLIMCGPSDIFVRFKVLEKPTSLLQSIIIISYG